MPTSNLHSHNHVSSLSNKTNIINVSIRLINDFHSLSYLADSTKNPVSPVTTHQLKSPTESYFTNIFQNIRNSLNNSSSNQLVSSISAFSISNSFNNPSCLNADYCNAKSNNSKFDGSCAFLSTLLSTILKHHLSWVYTVLPSNEVLGEDLTNSAFDVKTKLRKQRANWTSILEKTNPYNPLWAQLSDLHGAVNQPLKLVRTVVVGQNREMVERVLFLLSYFIRCGNSSYFDIMQDNFDFNKLISPLMFDLNLSQQLPGNTDANATNTLAENSMKSTNASNTSPREVDISDLKSNPLAQLSLILGTTMNHQTQMDKTSNGKHSVSMSNVSSMSPPVTNSTSSSSSPLNTLQNNKSRHVSSSSIGLNCNAQELPLIGCKMKPNHAKSTRMQDNFGYSLLASYCEEFVFEFVLHGTKDRTFLSDLQQRIIFCKNVRTLFYLISFTHIL